jgi:hypothetical protein
MCASESTRVAVFQIINPSFAILKSSLSRWVAVLRSAPATALLIKLIIRKKIIVSGGCGSKQILMFVVCIRAEAAVLIA